MTIELLRRLVWCHERGNARVVRRVLEQAGVAHKHYPNLHLFTACGTLEQWRAVNAELDRLNAAGVEILPG